MASRFEGHTPGPWEAEPGRDNYRVRIAGTMGSRWNLAKVYKIEDAELMAAAPDLLAENERLREALEQIRDEAVEERYQNTACLDILGLARAALEGGER